MGKNKSFPVLQLLQMIVEVLMLLFDQQEHFDTFLTDKFNLIVSIP